MGCALNFTACNKVEESAPFRDTASATSSSLAPSRWNSSQFPLQIKISEDFENDEDQAIRDMATAWSDSVSNKASFMDASFYTSEKDTVDLNAYEDAVIGVYKMLEWPSELPTTALAVTQIIGLRKNAGSSSEYIEIQHADILVNYEIFGFTTDRTFGYDLQTILLHEMGHLLGLYHNDSSVETSVMYPSITRSVENRYPKSADIEAISEKYGLSRSSSAKLAFKNDENTLQEGVSSADEEVVVVQFELMANGEEVRRVL